MKHYDEASQQISKLITSKFSTSFTLGIKTLAKKYHFPVYGIYAFVRLGDEIVDTFHQHDKTNLLARYKSDSYKAIAEKISLNPVLHSFQRIVNHYQIDHRLIEAFFESMEMDLDKKNYNRELYQKYIFGSAEVVGLMCLKVFCDGDINQYEKLKQPARKLGEAFQKVNFLRDIRADYRERGRLYFPGLNVSTFTDSEKKKIEQEIEKDFQASVEGIKKLPKDARPGIYLAYIYYKKLFKKIKKASSREIMKKRFRISNFRKIIILLRVIVLSKLNLI